MPTAPNQLMPTSRRSPSGQAAARLSRSRAKAVPIRSRRVETNPRVMRASCAGKSVRGAYPPRVLSSPSVRRVVGCRPTQRPVQSVKKSLSSPPAKPSNTAPPASSNTQKTANAQSTSQKRRAQRTHASHNLQTAQYDVVQPTIKLLHSQPQRVGAHAAYVLIRMARQPQRPEDEPYVQKDARPGARR